MLKPEQESPQMKGRLWRSGEAGEQICDGFTTMDELKMRQNMWR